MHLINIYRNENYNYPGINVGFNKIQQTEMVNDFIEWWKIQ